MTQPDPIALLLRLRAEMVRMAHEVEMMADYRKLDERKPMAERIAQRMRDAAMANDVAAACEHPTAPIGTR